MRTLTDTPRPEPKDVLYSRATINLATGGVSLEEVPCANLEDVLGGFGRSFQILGKRDIAEAYAAENPLIVNTGLLTGSSVMTGLRSYFSAYSPLKGSQAGKPSAMWSAGSGKFGSKLKWTGLDELVFEGQSAEPVVCVLRAGENGPEVTLTSAKHLLGKDTHEKIMALQADYADAHFAVIGPAGEHWQNNYMAAVALSTENQLKSKDDKCRFAGRGGMGSVMGSKNLIAIVAQSKDNIEKLTPELRDLTAPSAKGRAPPSFARPTRAAWGAPGPTTRPWRSPTLCQRTTFAPRARACQKRCFAPMWSRAMSSRPSPASAVASTATRTCMRKVRTARRGNFWPSSIMSR